jgi:hypothetical protein
MLTLSDGGSTIYDIFEENKKNGLLEMQVIKPCTFIML